MFYLNFADWIKKVVKKRLSLVRMRNLGNKFCNCLFKLLLLMKKAINSFPKYKNYLTETLDNQSLKAKNLTQINDITSLKVTIPYMFSPPLFCQVSLFMKYFQPPTIKDKPLSSKNFLVTPLSKPNVSLSGLHPNNV